MTYRTLRALAMVFSMWLPTIAAHAGDLTVIYNNTYTFGAFGLIAVDGDLYTGTEYGVRVPHQCNCGTLYKLTTDGQVSVVHTFTGGQDGRGPYSLVRSLNRVVGLAEKSHFGASIVFGFDQTGDESIYYANRPGSRDPKDLSGLGDVGGHIVVTSTDGGSCPNAARGGTIFTVRKDTSSVRKTLHTFCGAADGGAAPYRPVAGLNGVIYGIVGYLNDNVFSVFSLAPSGAETVLHTFKTDDEGETIQGISAVTLFNGELYGTFVVYSENGLNTYTIPYAMDQSGNVKQLGRLNGYGNDGFVRLGQKLYGVNANVLFSIAADGRVTIEHVFHLGDTAGHTLYNTPVVIGNALYGSTSRGGASKNGTVFKFVP